MKHGFDELHLDQIVAFTLTHNRASRGVMEHCGFTYKRDIVHADLPHVLYLLEARNFSARHKQSLTRCLSCPRAPVILTTGATRPEEGLGQLRASEAGSGLQVARAARATFTALAVTLHLPN